MTPQAGPITLPKPMMRRSPFGRGYGRLNRQSVAFAVSLLSKAALFAFDLWDPYPLASTAAFLAPDLWILVGLLIPNTSLLVPTATWFATSHREIWLTIDDGPEPATLPAMLDTLDRYGAKATFFVVGEQAEEEPGLLLEILRRGHTLGYHTATHPLATFWCAGPRRTTGETREPPQLAALRREGEPRWFRSPAGIKTLFLRRALARTGTVLVGWSARGRENVGSAVARPLLRLKRRIRPGAIVLLHESGSHGPARVALLAGLLEHLAQTGYRCVIPAPEQLRSGWDAAPQATLPPPEPFRERELSEARDFRSPLANERCRGQS